MKNPKTIISIIILYILVFFNMKKKECVKVQLQKEVVINYSDYNLAKEFIKKSEGLRLETYELDNNFYIGYGQKVSKQHPNITELQADSMLEKTLFSKLYYVVNRYDVTGNEALALAMLFYAVKPSAIRNSNLNRELLTTKDSTVIRNSWTSFCLFQGKPHRKLKERREFEVNLYFKK